LDRPLRDLSFNLWPLTRQTRSAAFSWHSGTSQACACHRGVRTGRGFAPRIRRMPQQFPLAQEAQRRLAMSQVDTKRCGNLGQAFPSGRMTVTPIGASRQLVKNFRACFWCGLGRKLIPEVFYQLQTLESAKMFNGLQCGFHAQSLARPVTSSATWSGMGLRCGGIDGRLTKSVIEL
jgi:hypothetical protein